MDVVGLAGKQNGMVEWLENLRGRGRIEGFAGDPWRKIWKFKVRRKKEIVLKKLRILFVLSYIRR